MKKILFLFLVLMMLLANTSYAKTYSEETGEPLITVQTADGFYIVVNQQEKNAIDNLKAHTVIVEQREYYSDGTYKYYHAAGFAIDKRHILTVDHITQSDVKSDNFYFAQEGATPYMVTIVKTDPLHDIALLEIDKSAPDLIADSMKFSDGFKIGDSFFSIGHPDKSYELLRGTIDIKARVWHNIEGVMIHAHIEDGDSGGLAINNQGDIVGMVFCKSEADIGFMISKDDIQNFLK